LADWRSDVRDAEELRAERIFLQELCQGQAAAWQQLVALWSPRLYSYVSYNTYSIDDAQALLQQTFSFVMQRLINHAEQPKNLAQLTILLVSTLYRLILQYQQSFGVPLFDHRHAPPPLDPQQQKFIAALAQLAPPVQQLLLLRYLVGLSIGELASIIGFTPPTVIAIVQAAAQHFPPSTFTS